MKSIMGLGRLPKKDPQSCRAWLHGKLFTSLPVERMIGAAKTFSSEQVVAVALRNTLPEFLATAAKTSILVKFIRNRLDLSGTEGSSLAA